ncbi:MAG: hypothetical protein AB2556_22395 [Candidatus Thiodiazotropha sp.]
MVTIISFLVLDGWPDQQKLVLNDVVEVPLQNARKVLDGKWGQDWALGYAITVHSSQGLTIADQSRSCAVVTKASHLRSRVSCCTTGCSGEPITMKRSWLTTGLKNPP